jgi:mercuric ion transport protein
MRIQLLWFPGCPNVDAARSALREAMARAGIEAPVEEIDITAPSAPAELRGWGSPTILVDGADVTGEAGTAQASCCRVYDETRAPGVDAIVRALRPGG